MAKRVLDQDKLAYSVKVSLNQADHDMLAAEAKDTGYRWRPWRGCV